MTFTDIFAVETYTITGRGAHLSLQQAAHPILPTYAKALQSPSVSEIA